MKQSATQMNVRIDPSLKAEGDAIFGQLGYTPSGAVRLLYQLAVSHRYEPEHLLEALEVKKKPSSGDSGIREAARKGRGLFQDACESLGLACEAPVSQMSYEELRELSLAERFGGQDGR